MKSMTATEVKKEVQWCFNNIILGGDFKQIQELIRQDCLQVMSDNLTSSDQDLLLDTLKGCNYMLSRGNAYKEWIGEVYNEITEQLFEKGVYEKIEGLYNHSNNEI